MSTAQDIQGSVAEGFESVRMVFADHVNQEADDYAAQLAAYHRGQLVVDLWVGPDIDADSLMGIYSATKGAAHLIAGILVQEGVLDLDQRVAHYWPEFAVHGKGDVLLRDLFSHRAGLVGADDGFSADELADDQIVAERLGAQRPYWRPGAYYGYHALVIGALTGEVVRRATGTTIQALFAERVQAAHDVDIFIGLPEDQDHRFVSAQPQIVTPERRRELAANATGPDSLTGIAFNRNNPTGPEVWELPNIEVIRRKGPASFGAVGSARGMARMYAAMIGPVDGREPLLNADTLEQFGQIQSIGYDLVQRQLRAWAVGFHASSLYYPVLGQGSIGHSGAGGQQALADPRNELAYGFQRRRSPFPSAPAPENERLIPAIHAAAAKRAEDR